ncbi:hypothetical protein B7P43_G07358 [Cryptotermes secundus]|uniref:Uncharacterized protein n=1 Tax=Cryptotermes secundus TaxID=105785 RepID=A0A2J7PMV7_9NEOP|nr:hypothetical protein B7P43_G07358 [Cryptotermes secundus]
MSQMPSTATNQDNIQCACDIVLPMKSSTTDLGFIKSVQDGSQNNPQCCINKHYGVECDAFLDRIITGDETWIHNCEPESKRQGME